MLSRTTDLKIDTDASKQRSEKNCFCIDKINNEIDYEVFVKKYLIPNNPCLFGPWITKDWLCMVEWINENGGINWEKLDDIFGESEVPVIKQSINDAVDDYGNEEKVNMNFKNFSKYLKSKENRNNNNMEENSLLYLKDWHCSRDNPDYLFYKTPIYFSSDWLNEYWTEECSHQDDYKFVYIGPKGSRTPLHSDVLRSFSWSANVKGTKLWHLYRPGEEPVKSTQTFFSNIELEKIKENDEEIKVCDDNVFRVIQKTGEILFVPSGWFHQVTNLEDTISINHNWLNAFNIDISFNFLKLQHNKVVKEIFEHKDMDGFDEQCQMILRADSGMDFIDFYNFLYFILSKRLKKVKVKTKRHMEIPEKYIFEANRKAYQNAHQAHDLKALNETMKCIMEEIQELKIDKKRMNADFEKCRTLFQDIIC